MTSPITSALTRPFTYPLTDTLGAIMGQGSVPVVPVFGPDQPAYIRPTAQGDGSGLDYDNAGSLSALPDFLHLSAPGTTVYIIADDGDYTVDSGLNALLLDGGGSAENPVTIAGVDSDLDPMKPTFRSTRRDPSEWLSLGKPTRATTSLSVSGYDVFMLAGGLHDVVFTDLDFESVGCCFNPLGDLARVTLQHITFSNVFSFFTDDLDNLGAFRTEDAYLNDTLTFDDIVGRGFSIGGVRIGQRHHRLSMSNLDLDAQKQACDNFCEVIHVSGTTQLSTDSDWLALNPGGGHILDTAELQGAYYFSSSPNYPNNLFANADGYADESNCRGALLKNVYSHDNTDAAFDCKSKARVCNDCVAKFSKEDVKEWAEDAVWNNLETDSPVKQIGTGGIGHISIFGSGTPPYPVNPTFNNLKVRDTLNTKAALVLMQGSAAGAVHEPVFDTYDIVLPVGTVALDDSAAPNSLSPHFNPPLPTIDLAVNYRDGFTTGRFANGTAAGTAIADLAVTGSGSAGAVLELIAAGGLTLDGTVLKLAATLDADAMPYNGFTVRATSPEGLASATASDEYYVDGAAPVFACDWNGSNGATTATDDAKGATPTFTGCVLSTSSPIEGTASLLMNAGGSRVTWPDSDDWWLQGMFTILCKANISTLANPAVLMAHWNSGANQRAWQLLISALGEVQFQSTPNGQSGSIVTIGSGAGAYTAGATREFMVTRDAHNVVRVFLDGTMVAKGTVTGAIRNSTAGLTIGNTANGAVAATGKIDHTKVWKGWPFCATDSGYTVT